MENFEAGRKHRNDKIQVLDLRYQNQERPRGHGQQGHGTGTWVTWDRDLDSGTLILVTFQETRLGIWMLWEMTFYRAYVPTCGNMMITCFYPPETVELVHQRDLGNQRKRKKEGTKDHRGLRQA